jgi:putative transposase
MSRPKRLRDRTHVGRARYFLTFSVRNRRPLFKDEETALATITPFQRTASESSFAVLAYCLMPDHAHLLVEGETAVADLRRFAKMAKQRSGGVYRRRFRERLWQAGYFERVLRDRDDAWECARYIINNPVRAGLVASPHAYPFLGAPGWSLEELLGGGSTEQDPPYTPR